MSTWLRGTRYFAVLSSCAIGCAEYPPPVHTPESASTLAQGNTLVHHFGSVISNSGLRLDHVYRLVNRTVRDIEIVDVVNLKPCCGQVRFERTNLRPNQTVEIEVSLSIRQDFGAISHGALVLTDPPQSEELILRTLAQAYPRIRFEESNPGERMTLLTSDEPRSLELRVFAHGAERTAPINLDQLEVRCPLQARWVGPARELALEDGLRTLARSMTVLVDPKGKIGERGCELALIRGPDVVLKHVVRWESVACITASPKVIVLSPSATEGRAVLRSRDGRDFRIRRLECAAAGLRVKLEDQVDASSAVVRVVRVGEASPADERAVIKLFTDRPELERIDISVVLLN